MDRLVAIAIVILLISGLTMSYALAYRYVGLIDDGQVTHDPITCLYFSIVTWTTLGYGDVRPTPGARLIAASEAVVGLVFIGAYIGWMSVLFRRILGVTQNTNSPSFFSGTNVPIPGEEPDHNQLLPPEKPRTGDDIRPAPEIVD